MLSSLSAKTLLPQRSASSDAWPRSSGSPVCRRCHRLPRASLLLASLLLAVSHVSAAAAASSTAIPAMAAQPAESDREIAALLLQLETVWGKGVPAGYFALLAPSADRPAAEQFAAQEIHRDISRVTLRERDRVALPDTPAGTGLSLVIEALVESSNRGNIGTWRLDIVRTPPASAPGADAAAIASAGPGSWAIKQFGRLTGVQGLYRLTLDTSKQFRIKDLVVTAEDLTLTIPSGVAFAANAESGATAWVLLGRGAMNFHPKPAAERGQIKLFAGSEQLRSELDMVFLRLNPGDADARLSKGSLVEEPTRPQDLLRAQAIFNEEIVKSFGLDLSDLSRDAWSLVPPYGDFVAEMRTGKFGVLTYARSSNDAEDISLFDRRRRKNLSAYASEVRLATRGRFYSESDQVDYEIEHYDINSTFEPQREWIDGRTVLRLRVRAHVMTAMTLRLADSLTVRSVSSPRWGRLLSLRVKGQNSILVNFPETLSKGEELTLAVAYAGRLASATPEREVIAPQQDQSARLELVTPPEPRMLYTNRSYWYPQATIGSYATATLRLTVPEGMGCVATGALASGSPVRMQRAGEPATMLSVFTATEPARYFAVLISRFMGKVTDTVRRPPASPSAPPAAERVITMARAGAEDRTPQSLALDPPAAAPVDAVTHAPATPPVAAAVRQTPGASGERQPPQRPKLEELQLSIVANPRQGARVRSFAEQASSILSTYAGILEDIPYPTFTLSLVDDPLPGGHSPAYFAMLHQPMPLINYTWRNDPVSFDRYPQFFVAHELAHQFWGDAVGGENYHEQWISEGFAQYFAVMYAERTRPKDTFEDVLRQLRRTARDYDRYGPVWLGYRLGHLQSDSRVFRALVYNKGALVLHMLRRLVGEEAFFSGLRRFYRESRFKKVGTDDVRKAFEAESGRSLERFFEEWILQSGVPRVGFSHSIVKDTNGGQPELHLRIEQKSETTYDFPVTVRIRYADDRTEDVIVIVTDRTVERTIPLRDTPRDVRLNADDAALIEVDR